MGQLEQAGEVRQCVIQDSPEGAGAVGALLGLPAKQKHCRQWLLARSCYTGNRELDVTAESTSMFVSDPLNTKEIYSARVGEGLF